MISNEAINPNRDLPHFCLHQSSLFISRQHLQRSFAQSSLCQIVPLPSRPLRVPFNWLALATAPTSASAGTKVASNSTELFLSSGKELLRVVIVGWMVSRSVEKIL